MISLPESPAPLLPCPFCGAAAALEPDPWAGESVRIACENAACLVAPKSEYLLVRFAAELRAAWNGRLGAPQLELRAGGR